MQYNNIVMANFIHNMSPKRTFFARLTKQLLTIYAIEIGRFQHHETCTYLHLIPCVQQWTCTTLCGRKHRQHLQTALKVSTFCTGLAMFCIQLRSWKLQCTGPDIAWNRLVCCWTRKQTRRSSGMTQNLPENRAAVGSFPSQSPPVKMWLRCPPIHADSAHIQHLHCWNYGDPIDLKHSYVGVLTIYES